ncbi:MAG TPA: ROK family transcriptional regulator [Polyangiaceae bacterium]|nr:ROK family transcriptional regulator [Polyangiaceae bacterium]
MSAVPASLRVANQAQVLEALLGLGAASRAELAKSTGMSQPTAGKIVDELLAAAVLEEVSADALRAASVGRPGKQLRLARGQSRFVLIELGVERTRVLAAPIAPLDEERWDAEFKTPTSEAAWLRALRQHTERLELYQPLGVVVSAPGVIDEKAGRILLSPNLHWTERAELPERLQELFGAPVLLLQEIAVLSLGELAGRRSETDFLLVDVGEGVGGSVVLGGRPYQGPLPVRGEIGHTPIPGNTRACGCGGQGCMETLIAEPGLLRSFRAQSRRPNADFEELKQKLEKSKLPRWLCEALDATAMCLVAALNLYGLGRVVLTGLIGELGAPAREYLKAAVEHSALWSRFESVSVEYAPRHRARGLGLSAFQRIVLPGDWALARLAERASLV